jgi:GT2 family glycosyltransferase
MISIIICSIDDARFSAVSANYSDLLKSEPHEIIRIGDAKSLCEGYNRGIARSRGEHLIFSHDDIEILNQDFAARLKEHLSKFDVVGVVGTNRMVRGEWISAGPPYIFGQVAQRQMPEGFTILIFNQGRRIVGGMHALDGLFFAVRRSVVEKVAFDAQTFDGFHHYDLDFTFAAHLAGFNLAVASDIHIIHSSPGAHDAMWGDSLGKFERKYARRLLSIPPRRFTFAAVGVGTKREVTEVMSGGYAD